MIDSPLFQLFCKFLKFGTQFTSKLKTLFKICIKSYNHFYPCIRFIPCDEFLVQTHRAQ